MCTSTPEPRAGQAFEPLRVDSEWGLPISFFYHQSQSYLEAYDSQDGYRPIAKAMCDLTTAVVSNNYV